MSGCNGQNGAKSGVLRRSLGPAICVERDELKTGYTEFARLESSADAIHSAIVSPVVAMAAEVHCQRSPVACSAFECLSAC